MASYKEPVRVEALEETLCTGGPNGVKVRRTELRALAREIIGRGSGRE